MTMRDLSFVCVGALLITPRIVSAADQIITGTTRLDKDAYYKADSLTFADGSMIVTNGFRLTLEGTVRIRFEGTPRVISF